MRRSRVKTTPAKSFQRRQEPEMNSFAAASWQNRFYRKISKHLRIPNPEEISILRSDAEMLESLRKKLSSERFD